MRWSVGDDTTFSNHGIEAVFELDILVDAVFVVNLHRVPILLYLDNLRLQTRQRAIVLELRKRRLNERLWLSTFDAHQVQNHCVVQVKCAIKSIRLPV